MTNDKIELLAKAYKNTFSSTDGKLVLDDLKAHCGYDKTSVCEQNPDELQTFFSEGKRRVYLRILWYLERKKNG